jgi:hypothetical protein
MPEYAPHPVFARIYAKVAEMSERRGGAEHRQTLLAGLSGRVIEIGAGSGANFSHYPTTVDEVLAVEPERYLRERALRAAVHAPVMVSVVDGVGDRLPGEAGSFDAGGGELRFYEHVAAHSKWESRFQRLADATFWPHVAGGCHLTRDTTAGIERAGFVIETCERFPFSPAPLLPPDPHILGTARRPMSATQHT